MAFFHDPQRFNFAILKYLPGQKEEVKAELSAIWKKFDKIHPADITFYEDIKADMRAAMQAIINLALISGGYIIFIALCGLLGMAMYTTELRMKEIGIRKVFGSSVSGAVYTLSKDYMKLILYSSAFAIPSFYCLSALARQAMANVPGLSIWIPIVTLIFVLSLALLTLSSQTVKAALTNPVDTLREE